MTRPLANITREALEPVWNRHDIPTEVIAARLGVTRQALSLKARSLGLPSREGNRRKKSDDDTFRRMWLAGVSSTEMAEYFGYSRGAAVSKRRKMLGLPPRTRGKGGDTRSGWKETITIAQFREQELAERMKRDAEMGRARRRRIWATS